MEEPLAEVTAAARRRYAARGPEQPQPELPFCIDLGNGRRFDAMRQLRGTLCGLLAVLLLLAAGITAIFSTGVAMQVLLGAGALAMVLWLLYRTGLKRAGSGWRREAQPFPAALVMAHSSVYEPGPSIVPGVLLVDFGSTPDTERM